MKSSKFKLIQILVVTLALAVTSASAQRGSHDIVRIVTLEDSPMFMKKDGAVGTDLKVRYEGFAEDFADILSRELDFNYTLHTAVDATYGNFFLGKWNGMIGELQYIDGRVRADLAIASLTVTKNRSEVVDFSLPFIQFQLAILVYDDPSAKAGDKDKDGVNDEHEDDSDGQFVFLKPLSVGLWITFILSAILLLFLIFLAEKFVVAKMRGDVRRPGDGFFDGFCLKVFGPPRSLSARVLQIIFWVFVIIVFSSYLANFTADRVMDSSRHETELPKVAIQSVQDLLKQPQEFQIGAFRGGSTYHYLKSTEDKDLQQLFKRMNDAGSFLQSNQLGIDRVRQDKGKYAFIMEAPGAKFATTRRPCNLALAPKQFGPKRGYAIATPRNSPWSENMNLKIMELRESGVMADLERKWYEDLSECPVEIHKEDSDFDIVSEHSPLTVVDMAGTFYLLVACLIISVAVAFVEISMSTAKYK